ncbi:putative integral membrane protein (TIGR00698 family) [Bacillus tianshenii]|uniref:Integral membrane protein (TIGR00698 family) n=1 Tax=Sutcliffiella tianshenii TaxID=1463404 RepID=A0ABS2P5I5_9BACI|nr:putative sulfate exporter family transporter [Bacillus tianshenii]MBM7622225.1 putative integral membrane protein (TIGR00698 family) [Bacillus tianshenii]
METNQDNLQRFIHKFPSWLPGTILVFLIAMGGKAFGNLFPAIGGVIFALLLGIVLRNSLSLHEVFFPGIQFVVKKLLKVSIVLLGATLSIGSILDIGSQSIFVILLVVIGGILVTLLAGKMLKIDKMLSLLIGVGTSICGATAISVVKGVVQSKETITAYAISTIFFFNILATFLYPWIGQWLNLTVLQFGIWIGTSIHDTSSVVAVGYLVGEDVGEVATTVKLVRTLFILPLVLAISFIIINKSDKSASIKGAFPLFIIGFLIMSALYSVGVVSEGASSLLGAVAKFLIIMVMAGVGLQVEWRKFRALGLRPFLAGFIASVFVAAISLIYVIYMIV